MTYICYQGNDRDCGFASLKMLLANRMHDKRYLYIKKPSKKKDYTFYDLMNIAKSYGFGLSAYIMPVEDFKDIPRGTLVMLNESHLVYLKRVGKRHVTYLDPNIGKVRVKHSEFMRSWTGQVLECTNTKDAKECKAKKIKLMPLWMDFVYYGILSVVFASLLTGFYLIKISCGVLHFTKRSLRRKPPRVVDSNVQSGHVHHQWRVRICRLHCGLLVAIVRNAARRPVALC